MIIHTDVNGYSQHYESLYRIHCCGHCHWYLLPSQAVFPYTCIHVCRQEAFRRAVSNAKSKAQCISQTIGVQLGAALEVTELSQDEISHSISSSGLGTGEMDDPGNPRSRGDPLQMFNEQKLTYTSQVSVVFEAHPLKSCSHKKCHHKH